MGGEGQQDVHEGGKEAGGGGEELQGADKVAGGGHKRLLLVSCSVSVVVIQ